MRRTRTRRGCSSASASRAECQQLIIDVGGLRSVHPQIKEKAGRKPLKDIKTMKEDAAGVEKMGRGDQGALQQALQGVRTTTMRDEILPTRRPERLDRARSPRAVFAEPVRAAAPPAEAITPALIEAAKKEGKCSFYTAMDLQFAEKLGKEFEAKFPGIAVRVERSGAERVFTRIGQEYSSNIHAVDVVNTADQSHCHRLEAQRLARAVPARGCRASTTTSSSTTPTASRWSTAHAGLADRPTTPTW